MSTAKDFHGLVSAIDYPMFIVTAASNGAMAGCLVGFVTQASIEPPRLAVMLSKENQTYRVARESPVLAVHFLSEENLELARIFGERTGDDTDKFRLAEWEPSAAGVPLLRGTRGWAWGSVVDRLDAGDHVLHLIEVQRAARTGAGAQLGFQAVKDLHPGHPA